MVLPATMLTITVEFQQVKQAAVTQEKGIVYQPRNPTSSNKENTGRKNDITKQVEAKRDATFSASVTGFGY